MNKSYKLFGLIFDKIKESKKEYIYVDSDCNIQDYHEKRNLFDGDISIRKINLSVFFTIESKHNLENLISEISSFDELMIRVDFNLEDNNIFSRFISKRLKQVLFLLEENNIKVKELMKE